MKTWITYPAAIILGFAANSLLGGWAPYEKLLLLSVPLVKEIALFILLPVVFVLFAGATASARRHKETTLVFSLTIIWGLFSTLLLSFAAMGITLILPFRSLTAEALQAMSPSANHFFDFANLKSFFVSDNAFSQFTITSSSLVPVMVLALLFGIALRPDKEEIRPAYVVLNSFSEAMLRLARIFTALGAFFLLLISAAWFKSFDFVALLGTSFWYVVSICAIALLATIVVLPIMYHIFTGFRGGSALRVGFGTFPAMFAAAITGNLFYGTTPLIALSSQNNATRKRVTGISIPLFTIIGRGGSAMIATFTIIELLLLQGAALSIQQMVFIALFASLFSIGSAFSVFFEVPFIIFMVLQGIGVGSPEMVVASLALILPVIRLTSVFVDTAVAAYGAAFCSRSLSRKDRAPYRAMI